MCVAIIITNNKFKTMATMTFKEIETEWKVMKKNYVKKSTFSAYLLAIENHLLPNFENKTFISESDVQEFVLLKYNEGLSYKSIKDIVIVLKMVLRYGAKKGYITMPTWDIIIPAEKRKDNIEVFSIDSQKQIMRFIRKNFTFKNLGIYICLSTGLRIGEVCALQWKDIDVTTGLVSVSKTVGRVYIIDENEPNHTELIIDTPKTRNSIREIPMPNELIRIIKPIKKVVNSNYYVLTNDETPMEPRTYRNYYKKLIKRLNIPDLKFHGLRHSFATRCIESNCDYKTVSVILGHSNISTTLNLYVHPNFEQKKKCINKMFQSIKY